jgi:hypothetical protein
MSTSARPAALVALNGLALVIVLALYFGETRMRLPYTYILGLLALELVAWSVERARCLLGATRAG